MSGPIAALLRSLRLAGLDIDAEAALDSMWLGTRMLAAERARAAAAVATTDTSSIAKRPSGSTSRESERRSSGSFRRDSIAMRAYELYLERGGQDGFDQQDWSRAEAEILSKYQQQKEKSA